MIIEGEIRNVTEFGLFVGLTERNRRHGSPVRRFMGRQQRRALKAYKKGDMVKAKILDSLPRERVALGIKQLTKDPHEGKRPKKSSASKGGAEGKGEVVTATVSAITSGGIEVTVGDQKGFIKKSDLSRERSEQRSDRFAVGEKIDAKVMSTDKKGQLNLSIKAREIDEDKQAMKEFGSTESGASLGDILGAALGKKSEDSSEEKPKAKKASKKKADDAEEAEEKPKKKKKKDEE
jgi:small subunit ribosomal protein S1